VSRRKKKLSRFSRESTKKLAEREPIVVVPVVVEPVEVEVPAIAVEVEVGDVEVAVGIALKYAICFL